MDARLQTLAEEAAEEELEFLEDSEKDGTRQELIDQKSTDIRTAFSSREQNFQWLDLLLLSEAPNASILQILKWPSSRSSQIHEHAKEKFSQQWKLLPEEDQIDEKKSFMCFLAQKETHENVQVLLGSPQPYKFTTTVALQLSPIPLPGNFQDMLGRMTPQLEERFEAELLGAANARFKSLSSVIQAKTSPQKVKLSPHVYFGELIRFLTDLVHQPSGAASEHGTSKLGMSGHSTNRERSRSPRGSVAIDSHLEEDVVAEDIPMTVQQVHRSTPSNESCTCLRRCLGLKYPKAPRSLWGKSDSLPKGGGRKGGKNKASAGKNKSAGGRVFEALLCDDTGPITLEAWYASVDHCAQLFAQLHDLPEGQFHVVDLGGFRVGSLMLTNSTDKQACKLLCTAVSTMRVVGQASLSSVSRWHYQIFPDVRELYDILPGGGVIAAHGRVIRCTRTYPSNDGVRELKDVILDDESSPTVLTLTADHLVTRITPGGRCLMFRCVFYADTGRVWAYDSAFVTML